MNTEKLYTVQVEIEMHDGPSANDVITVSATSEDDAMSYVRSTPELLDAIADEYGGYGVVMCVDPQLAWEGRWVSPDTWLLEVLGETNGTLDTMGGGE